MMALLRADWLRLRRRRDLWIILVAVCLISGVGFLSGYRSDAQDPPPFNRAEFEQMLDSGGFFDGMTQAEIPAARAQMIADAEAQDAQAAAEHEAEQAIQLQKYAFPQSLLTVLGSGLVLIVALTLAASLVVGDEFRFGTVRTSLLAAGNRRSFLLARLGSLLAMTVGLFVIVIAVATVLSVALRLVGAEVPASTMPIDVGATIGLVGAQILAATVVIVLTTALTVLLRTGAMPLILVILGFLLETFIGALPVFYPGQLLAGVPQVFPGTAIRTLLARLETDTGAIVFAGSYVPPPGVELALPVVAAIVAAWGLLFLLVATRRIGTMDITE